MGARFKIRYDKDIQGTNEIMNGSLMVSVMLSAAHRGKDYAVAIAPKHTGHYAASFVTEAHDHGGPRSDRAEATLANTADYAADVEWRNHGGEHILAKTADWIESEYR
jgi:hypothetical protein